MDHDHYFISYSSVDGLDFSLKLGDALEAGPPRIPIWLDKRQSRPGEEWDEQIVEAIRDCKALLFIMTRDSVKRDSVCKNEWVSALKYKKPVIPLRLHRDAELPFRLASRNYIDFSENLDAALARLRQHLAWMDTPEGAIRALEHRLADNEREFKRAEPHQQARIEEESRELRQQIADQRGIIDDPEAASRRTEERIAMGLERERQPEPLPERRSKFINRPPAAAPSYFQDRHFETALIGDFLKDDSLRIATVVGRAGLGKTAMVCRLLRSLESGQLPDDRGPLSVDGIVYLSATGSRRVRLPHLYAGLCQLLPEATAQSLDAVYKNPHLSTEAKMQALTESFPGGRTVVLLDNFEDLVEPQTGDIRDPELDEALRALLTLPQHGIKVILTTRVTPSALRLLQPGRQTTIPLDEGLESPYAENILRAMDRDGKLGFRDAPEELLAVARERTRGYPRALEALYAILAADRDTTLPEILSDKRSLLPENVVQVLVGEAFSRLDSLAQRVMQALAVFAYPVPPMAVDYLLQPHLAGVDSAPVLRRLVNMQFARREAGNYYLHHVDRAYAMGRMPEGRREDWQVPDTPPYTRFSLQHRGAEYFREVRRDESLWKSIEDLSPLIAEFTLLAASGDYEGALEVLFAMLPFLQRWGYFRQVVRLAEGLSREAKDPCRSIASGLAGWALSALGETPRAIEHLKAALDVPTSDVEPARVTSWRLDLARCYAALADHDAAASEYRRILDEANDDDVETQVAALLGLGSAAVAHDSYKEAETLYLRALGILVPQLVMTASDEEEDKFVSTPGALSPHVLVTSAWAWHPLGPLAFSEGTQGYLFGIEISNPESSAPISEETPTKEEEATESVEVLCVSVVPDLADIWMSLADLYGRTNRLSEAQACCRVTLDICRVLELDSGFASALDLLRRLKAQFSDTEAEEIVAAQEEELKRARTLGFRRLEITILNDLAECYLQRGRVNDCEELYVEISRHAAELEDPSLQVQAELGFANIEQFREKHDLAAARLEKLLAGGLEDLYLQTKVMSMLGQVELSRHRLSGGRQDAATRYLLSASRGYAALGFLWEQVEAECMLAFVDKDRRDYDAAVRRLQSVTQLARAVDVPSLLTSVLCDLADAHLKAGDRSQALAVADEASRTATEIELPATAAQALVTIADIRAELREFEAAETAYQRAEAIYASIGDVGGQISTMHQMTRLYDRAQQPDAEIRTARLAWKLACDQKDPAQMRAARLELALALSDCGFHNEAVQHMTAVVDEAPYEASAITSLGWVLYQAGDLDRSLEESRHALEVDSGQLEAILNLGHAYLAKGLPDEAKREYLRAIQDRKGGENFTANIEIVQRLLAQRPDVPRGYEMLELLEKEQRKLDATEDPTDSTTSS